VGDPHCCLQAESETPICSADPDGCRLEVKKKPTFDAFMAASGDSAVNLMKTYFYGEQKSSRRNMWASEVGTLRDDPSMKFGSHLYINLAFVSFSLGVSLVKLPLLPAQPFLRWLPVYVANSPVIVAISSSMRRELGQQRVFEVAIMPSRGTWWSHAA
jgi:hypothetical protein